MTDSTDQPYVLSPDPLTEPDQVDVLFDSIRRWRIFAFDTEFSSNFSYSPHLALLQVATPELLAIVDPLASGSIDQPIWECAADPQILTVVHAYEQESRFIAARAGRPPQALFDVQLAAGFCGHRYPISYSALVRSELQIRLAASQARSNWLKRPLCAKQLRYALDDVRWLLPLQTRLAARLETTQRAGWLQEETAARIAALGSSEQRGAPRWRRFSGASRLNRRALAVLRELYAGRERAAMESNTPRRRVARDAVLVAIAAAMPRSADDLRSVRGCGQLSEQSSAALLEAVERGLNVPESELPRRVRAAIRHANSRKLTAFAHSVLDSLCAEHQLDSNLLGTNAEVSELVGWARSSRSEHNEKPRLLSGWRREFVGDTILAALDGRVALRIGNLSAEHPLVAVHL